MKLSELDDRLVELDDRLVPRLAARLREAVDSARERRRQVRLRVTILVESLLHPHRDSPLRRLDDRFASSGPLALLRDVPQLGLLLVSAVFLAGAGVALARSDPPPQPPTAAEQLELEAPSALGPEVGQRIDEYIATARGRAVEVSTSSPDRVYTALVTFAKYLTPQQAALAVGELPVSKVILHAKLPSSDVLPVAVTDLVPDLRKTYAGIARRKALDAAEFRKLAASIDPQSKEEEQFKAFYLQAATQSANEAKAYRGNCPCIIAALVRGPARLLAALYAVPQVRAVELGGREEDDTLVLRPLAPEQTGVVKKIVTPTGGQGA